MIIKPLFFAAVTRSEREERGGGGGGGLPGVGRLGLTSKLQTAKHEGPRGLALAHDLLFSLACFTMKLFLYALQIF